MNMQRVKETYDLKRPPVLYGNDGKTTKIYPKRCYKIFTEILGDKDI